MYKMKPIRKAKGLTQSKLAKRCGVSRSTISMIELGKNSPSVPLAKKIAELLDIDWTVFFK